MAILTAIASALGHFFKAILPELFTELRRRRRTEVVGGDADTVEAVNDSVATDVADSDFDPGVPPQ